MTALEPAPTATVSTVDDLAAQARGYIGAARAASTLTAYRSDWRQFTTWCADHHLDPLPAEPTTVALYVTDLAGIKAVSTIGRHLSSISVMHQAAGHDSPTRHRLVRDAMAGIRRTFGTAPRRRAPARTVELRAMLDHLDRTTLAGQRDAALLLVGFAGALRRSELVALDVADLTTCPDGLLATIRRSKTDQEGEGVTLGLPYGTDLATCPVAAVVAWLDAATITSGPVFRPVNQWQQVADRRLSGKAVNAVVQRAARAAGLDPTTFGGHSLRAGFATAAAEAGVPERDIARHTRHKSLPTLRTYIRAGSVWIDNAATRVGL